jgi:fructose-specific component phosphotransferase system IIB-like protein
MHFWILHIRQEWVWSVIHSGVFARQANCQKAGKKWVDQLTDQNADLTIRAESEAATGNQLPGKQQIKLFAKQTNY